MGKLKKRRNQRRHNPISRESRSKDSGRSNDGEAEKLAKSKAKISPLLEKLTSSSANDRSMAIGAITVLCEDSRTRKLLLKEKLIAIVMQECLNDSNDEIMVESYGLLRNLAIDEGYDVVKHYWRSSIWQSIEQSITKISQSFQYLQSNPDLSLLSKKQKEDEKSKQSVLYDFTEHVISLIVVIASGSSDLYDEVFSRIDDVLTLVVDLIKYNISSEGGKLPNKLFNSLLDFIYEFGNESNQFITKFSGSNLNLDGLNTFIQGTSNILAKTYLQGIKFHVNEVIQIEANKYDVSYNILSELFDNLSTINLDVLQQSLTKTDGLNQEKESTSQQPQDIDQPLGMSEDLQLAHTHLQALEITIDLYSSIWEYLVPEDQQHTLPEHLVELIFHKIIPSLIELVTFNQQNNDILSLADKLLVCLNNLAWMINSFENLPVQWYETSLQVWDVSMNVLQTNEQDDIKKNGLSLLWAITKSLGPEVKSKIDLTMIDNLLNLGTQYLTEIPANQDIAHLDILTSIIGFIGSVSIVIENTQITFKISEFVMQTIEFLTKNHNQNPKLVEILIESINLIFDIFGDASYPYDYEIFVEHNYLNRLTLINTEFKKIYKKIDKNKYIELKIRGEETWNNLGRFIDYKATERN